MKTEIKIIGISILLGFLTSLTDTIVDYFMFYEKPFLDLLIFDVSRFEIYIRSIIMAVFIISGLIISKISVKQKHAEQELKVYGL